MQTKTEIINKIAMNIAHSNLKGLQVLEQITAFSKNFSNSYELNTGDIATILSLIDTMEVVNEPMNKITLRRWSGDNNLSYRKVAKALRLIGMFSPANKIYANSVKLYSVMNNDLYNSEPVMKYWAYYEDCLLNMESKHYIGFTTMLSRIARSM